VQSFVPVQSSLELDFFAAPALLLFVAVAVVNQQQR
jgi:hypothetical protein